MQQLSGQDAMFLYGEMDNTPMHIGPVLIYDPSTAPGGFVRFKDVLRTFEERLYRSAVFTRKLVNVPFGLDHPFWIDDDRFDIEFHVRHIALPKPGDWRQLCIQIARLHARPLDRARPLWEAYIIEGLDNVEGLPPGSFAMFLKIHHAAIDGATGVEIMGALHDLSPDARPDPEKAAIKKRRERRPSDAEILRKVSGSVLKQPFGLAKLLSQSVPAWRRIQAGKKEKRFHALGEKERTRFNDVVSPHRVFLAAPFDLRDVVAIKRGVEGATVNDVMLSIVSGAMRRYLLDKGELPAKSLVAGAPVNVRSEEEKGSGGNVVSMMSISLRTDVDDPAERLRLVHDEAVNSKAYMNAMGARTLTDWTNRMPARVTALGFRAAAATGLIARSKPVFNTIVTNVPGPQVPLYMGGARLVHSFGAGPCMDGMGIFHVVTSYGGEIAISVQACRDMMPDPGFYEACLNESFAELKAAFPGAAEAATASAKATPGKKAARPARKASRRAAVRKKTAAAAAPRKRREK